MRKAGDVCFSQVFREGGGKMIIDFEFGFMFFKKLLLEEALYLGYIPICI